MFIQRLTVEQLALAWLATTSLAIWGTIVNIRRTASTDANDEETRPHWHYHVEVMPVLEESAFRIVPYYVFGTDAVWLLTGASIMLHKMPSLVHLVAITAAMLIFAKLVTIAWWAPIIAHAAFNASVLVGSAIAAHTVNVQGGDHDG
jgi:hypothetical protein